MANTPEENVGENVEESISLKDPYWAAFLAWLIPGLGHLYQGRTAKAVLYFVCIMSTFSYGLYLGSDSEYGWGRVVYASWRPGDKRLYFLSQIGVGLPAMPALVQAIGARNGKAPFGEFMAPPRIQRSEDDLGGRPSVHQLHRRMARYFELGTIYTTVAGLLNILAIFDALAGPIVVPGKEEEEESDKGEGTKDESGANQ
ncbi:MAG: hypothetical protein JXM70_23485 [Pirellulales bacterium]|nr:hypothetical protein [Pirellulales bacterium]